MASIAYNFGILLTTVADGYPYAINDPEAEHISENVCLRHLGAGGTLCALATITLTYLKR